MQNMPLASGTLSPASEFTRLVYGPEEHIPALQTEVTAQHYIGTAQRNRKLAIKALTVVERECGTRECVLGRCHARRHAWSIV